MCFSPQADLVGGVVICAIGVDAVRHVHQRREFIALAWIPRKGESFAAEVINRVMHGKGWPHTVLFWVYDEHGGYYDHIPPPEAVPPDDVEGRSLLTRPSWLRTCLRPFFPGFVTGAEKLDAGL